MAERTLAQVIVSSAVDGQLTKTQRPRWEKTVRQMRTDATLGFVRDLYMAPIVAAEWTVTAVDPEYQDAVMPIYEMVMPHRRKFLKDACRGLVDFGWQAYETIYEYGPKKRVTLKELKPLLQDLTYLMVDGHGQLVAVRNLPTYLSMVGWQSAAALAGPWTDLTEGEYLVLNRDVEGTNHYGQSLMERAERPWSSWVASDDAANRYDRKIAGAHWIVYYPLGKTDYNGIKTDNAVIAANILNACESSGKIAIPQKALDFLDVDKIDSMDDTKRAWHIELKEVSGNAENSFVGRQRYLDNLKARAFGIPERAVMEGQFGTKAEAEAHGDFMIDNIESAHGDIIEQLNLQLVNRLLEMNWGPTYVNKVKVAASPLSDARRYQLRQLYNAYFATEQGTAEEIDALDWDAIREELGYPVRKEQNTEQAELDPETGEPLSPDELAERDQKTLEADKDTDEAFVPAGGSGAYKGVRRREFKSGRGNVKDVLTDLEQGVETPETAQVWLEEMGMAEARARRLVEAHVAKIERAKAEAAV